MKITVECEPKEMAELINKIQIQPPIIEKCAEEVAKSINSAIAKF